MSAVVPSGVPTGSDIADLEQTITPRQLELLALYASGYSYEDIGRMKFLSPHTVKWHIAKAYARSGARHMTHLCMALAEAGMIRRTASGSGYEPVQDLRIAEE